MGCGSCSAVTLWTISDSCKIAPAMDCQCHRWVRVGSRAEKVGAKRCHHTWLRDWMALDSAAARARLCHMVAGVWVAG